MPESVLVKRLETVADLSEQDRALLHGLCSDVGTVPARTDIIAEGARPERVHLIIEGWAARYKLLRDGGRQIMAILIPGDFCDLHVTVLGHMDHGIVALTACKIAYIEPGKLNRLTLESSRLTKALWWSTLVDEAVLRQWIVNVGRRDGYQRVAHILCEIHARMDMIGLVEDDELALPLTQMELADVTGLTPVHVNRVLQRLRKEKLVEVGRGKLNVLDIRALKQAGGFDDNYLHIERRVH